MTLHGYSPAQNRWQHACGCILLGNPKGPWHFHHHCPAHPPWATHQHKPTTTSHTHRQPTKHQQPQPNTTTRRHPRHHHPQHPPDQHKHTTTRLAPPTRHLLTH